MAEAQHDHPGRVGLGRYATVIATVLALLLSSFLLVSALSVGLLQDPVRWLRGGPSGGVLSVTLLVADVALPVPSSLIMIANGALFGPVVGAALSVLGSVGAALAGYAIGRGVGARLLPAVCGPAERARADALVRRWGMLAVTVSRPVPLLAETVAIAAGASSLGPLRTAAAATIGALPGSVGYAGAGAAGVTAPGGLVVFAAVLAVAAVLWLVGRHRFVR